MPMMRLCHKKQIVINPILCTQDSRKQASKQAKTRVKGRIGISVNFMFLVYKFLYF